VATLDQLSPDRRAIIELVLQRGQSYEDLSGALGMPEARVREHAREALASLAPRTAERVDPQWRGQVADYVLGQQSGPQAKATRSHLMGSEAARTWALSVLDSVGHLYPNGAEPAIPASGRASDGEPDAAAAGPGVAAAGAAAASAGSTGSGRGDGAPPTATRRPLSDAARAHVRRRRIVAAVAGALVLVVAVLLLTGVFGGSDEPAAEDEAADTAAAADPEVLAQIALEPVGRSNGAGAAIIAEREGQIVLLMQGQLPPPGDNEAYVVWLYNSPEDSVAVAGPQIDRRGNFQALGPLPEDYERYEFLDVSVQQRGVQSDRRTHSGSSLLRGPVAGTPELSGEAPGGGQLPAPEEAVPPDSGALPAPEEAVPPDSGALPDPGSLPTVPEE
jgi:hypothetical protein